MSYNNDEVLKDHEERLRILEKNEAITMERLSNLIESLNDLSSTIKWLIGLWVTSSLGFIFWYIQNK